MVDGHVVFACTKVVGAGSAFKEVTGSMTFLSNIPAATLPDSSCIVFIARMDRTEAYG
jgi:hypothetical protein